MFAFITQSSACLHFSVRCLIMWEELGVCLHHSDRCLSLSHKVRCLSQSFRNLTTSPSRVLGVWLSLLSRASMTTHMARDIWLHTRSHSGVWFGTLATRGTWATEQAPATSFNQVSDYITLTKVSRASYQLPQSDMSILNQSAMSLAAKIILSAGPIGVLPRTRCTVCLLRVLSIHNDYGIDNLSRTARLCEWRNLGVTVG